MEIGWRSGDLLLVKRLLCLCRGRHTTEHEMQEQEREFPCAPEIPNSLIPTFSHGNAGEICGKSQLQVPEGWCTKASPGTANKCPEGSRFAAPDFVFPYTPEIPEQSHWQLLDIWDFWSHAAFGNVVHCGGSCHVFLFICFYSHLLLAALRSRAWQIFRSWAALT